MPLNAKTLHGEIVSLEPLEASHRDGLRQAAQDMRIWEFTLICLIGERFDPWFDQMLRENHTPSKVVFAVRQIASGRLIGVTSLFDYLEAHRILEIGSTWYHPDFWSTSVNPECKLLLFTHAFESVGVNRVQLVTDLLNTRSQAAISKLGAMREGVLRSHKITHAGRVRDTVVFSVIATEWPSVRDRLRRRLNLPVEVRES